MDENAVKPKKRRFDITRTKRYIEKQLRNRGKTYTTSSGKIIKEKPFVPQVACHCSHKCGENYPVGDQHKTFRKFYNTLDWQGKSLFIADHIGVHPTATKKSRYNPILPLKDRNYSRDYYLDDESGKSVRVCKNFFMRVLQISSSKIQRAISKQIENRIHPGDKRGKKAPKNKSNESDVEFVVEFISSIPQYESHYTRKKSQKKYLSPGLTIKKLYIEYCSKCSDANRNRLSETMFRKIFNTRFNLSFKRPKKDTCKTCDSLNIESKRLIVSTVRMDEISRQKEKHFSIAEKIKSDFNSDVEHARCSESQTAVLTFDLQKTLETPSLTTNLAYYKRKLWTYNLCVHDEVKKQGYFYMWSENVASRGAHEIASCIKKHIDNFISAETQKVILYSDACGGQNRNIKMNLCLKKMLSDSPTISEITQKFFLSGHSYNSCDRNFGLIEKERRKTCEIFTPKDWMDLVKAAKKSDPKFIVTEMHDEDFVSSQNLKDCVTNRKKSTENVKINWFNIQTITNKKDSPFTFAIKTYSGEQHVVSLKKKKCGVRDWKEIQFKKLNSIGCSITSKKYCDLMCLLPFIPENQREFYKNLNNDENPRIDNGLISGSEPESETENMEVDESDD